MAQPRLFQTLATLEKKEWRRLERFLDAPYHNTNATLSELYRLLRPHYPDFRECPPEVLYRQFFPDRPFRAKWLNDRFSELQARVEAFLLVEALRTDPELQRDVRRRVYGRRGRYRELSRDLHDDRQQLLERSVWDLPALRRLRDLRAAQFDLPDYRQPGRGHEIVTDLLQLTELEALFTRLHYSIDLLARGSTYAEADGPLIGEAQLASARRLAVDHPLLALYLQLFDLYRHGCSETAYREAIAAFDRLQPRIEPSTAAFLLVKLCSLGITQVMSRAGSGYIDPLFALYRRGVAEQYFTTYGFFPEDTFLNVCTIGAYARAFDWTADFIDRHQALLPERDAAQAVALGRAVVAFHAGDFNAVRQLLRDVSGRRLIYKLRIRSLRVRCLLCLHLEDASYESTLRSELRAYDRFLKRSRRLSPARRQAYRHFARAVRDIAELSKTDWQDTAARRRLAATLEALQPLALRTWLLEILTGDDA